MLVSIVNKQQKDVEVVAYDCNGRIFEPISDHIDYLLDSLHVGEKTLVMVSSHLRCFFDYLEETGIPWDVVDDLVLKQFRDFELVRVRNSGRSRNVLSAKRTVNQRLRYVYQYYYWSQELAHLISGVIGQDKPIQSSLAGLADKTSRYRRSRLDRLCYPVCFPMVGTASRYSPNVYTATTADVAAIGELFIGSTPAVGLRNLLLLDVADQTGMRVESIVSLKTYQFDAESPDTLEDVSIVPEVQKFGAQHPYSIPSDLYERVRRYIREVRRTVLEDLGVTEKVAKHHIFLNPKSGAPLLSNSVVHIFSKAFKSLNAPKGSGVHSLRRKRAQDVGDTEIEARRQRGLPVSAHEIAFVIARTLGQSTLTAQAAYVRKIQSELNESYLGRLARERRLLNNRVRELEQRLAEFERERKNH